MISPPKKIHEGATFSFVTNRVYDCMEGKCLVLRAGTN